MELKKHEDGSAQDDLFLKSVLSLSMFPFAEYAHLT
jgi:hypothetical protein